MVCRGPACERKQLSHIGYRRAQRSSRRRSSQRDCAMLQTPVSALAGSTVHNSGATFSTTTFLQRSFVLYRIYRKLCIVSLNQYRRLGYNDMYTVRYAASFAYRGNTLGRGRDGEIRQDIISQGGFNWVP